MNKGFTRLAVVLQFAVFASAAYANNEFDQTELYKSNKFALGIGAAIVRFDTKLKFTDKTRVNFDSIFIDPEGNLDLPEVSSVTTYYGVWNINPKHSLGFSFFNVNRESSILNFDETLEDVRIEGEAKLTDTTNFYQLNYGYTIFRDYRSNIKLAAGVYGIDLEYIFEAEGEITIDGVTENDEIYEEAKVFAPLPMVGLDFWYAFTPRWALATKVTFVIGSYEDVSATVIQAGINAQYRFTDHIGLVFGLASFDAQIDIEDDTDKQEVSYSYDGGYAGVHFMF
ncbi:MAG: hypothetical protein PVF35_03965 [Gammaproteobacteria bacterium]|jgi:hypothetical protein